MKNKIINILKKELREVFRDKKSLAMMFIIPIMIPLIVLGMSALFESQMNSDNTVYNKIGFAYNLSSKEEELIKSLEKVKNKEYDLIFMDIMMPEMNGITTFNHLKEIEGFNIPVIALTADAVVGAREKYLKLGFNDYIAKPININELKNAITKLKDGGKND